MHCGVSGGLLGQFRGRRVAFSNSAKLSAAKTCYAWLVVNIGCCLAIR